MHQESNLPRVPDDDPATERALNAIGRFSPQRGFEERVVSRVRVPLPHWLRGARDYARSLTSGVTGWVVLATFSLATAAAWTAAAVIGAQYSGEVAEVWRQGGREIFRVVRGDIANDLLPLWGVARAEVAQWLGSLGLDPQTAVVGYGAVMLVSAVGLRWLTAEPRKTRGPVDVAS
ncbi:MAG: hypothetical protein OEY20_06860 [Gemmatimonadota bacterium]|nr:hypothetical protein [Gemmatimonadota bacterium]MDH5196955.1 hypothetical protein [Gemmatimonadota bacterium]